MLRTTATRVEEQWAPRERAASLSRLARRFGAAGSMLVAVSLLVACASDGKTQSAANDPADKPADPEASASEAGRVKIPAAVVSQLDAWVAKDAMLLGEVVEIDATRVPFGDGQIGIEASRETDEQGRRLVERTESTDTGSRVVTVTLVNRSGMKTVQTLFPKVRLGGARTFVATDRLVLRYVPSPGADRPIVFTAVASGKARLLESDPDRKVLGSTVKVGAEVVRGPEGYRFVPMEESRP
jgi:hypothetical protein